MTRRGGQPRLGPLQGRPPTARPPIGVVGCDYAIARGQPIRGSRSRPTCKPQPPADMAGAYRGNACRHNTRRSCRPRGNSACRKGDRQPLDEGGRDGPRVSIFF
ncbi:hypothetical protein BHM03_00051069 [Ensete ventricosum]|uniref:Uncharacterized protein n=1 Tax=Ensete ventricosum TaxID=4639 RepID=A0A445MLQ8_ENSVE|nr:hypothetical protein BHM03_00051069 [Ensete ventricosum]